MIREVTSLVLAVYLIFLLVFLHRLGQGREPFQALMARLGNPFSVTLHMLALLAALYHSFTWFRFTPRIMPMRIGEEKVSDVLVAIGTGYLPWLVVSIVIAWALAR